MHEKTKDLLLGVGLLAVGIGALVVIQSAGKAQAITSGTLTPATMPSIYAGLLIALTLVFIANILRRLHAERSAARREEQIQAGTDSESEPITAIQRKTIGIRTAATLAAVLAYVLLLEYLHFFVVTALFLAVMFFVFGQRSLKKIALVSVCGGVALYGLFIYTLNLPI